MTSRTPGGRSIHHFHLSQFITIHDDIDIADPSSMQDACYIRSREVMGSIPVGDSDFSLSHARDCHVI